MESAVNNDTKKCCHCQRNKCDCESELLKNQAAKTYSSKKDLIRQSTNKKTNPGNNNSEGAKFSKWKEKINLFCQNKSEKKQKNKETESRQTDSKKKTELVAASNTKKIALKEVFPELKDITKVSGGVLTSAILEQRLKLLKKSHTLPLQLNGARHNSDIFKGKMEILGENGNSSREVSPMTLENSQKIEKNIVNGAPNKMIEIKPENAITHVTVTKPQQSPRCMLAVCSDHDGRHGGEVLEAVLYCAACMQSVCYKCAFEKHKDHKVSPIQVAAENTRINLAERKRKIENSISQMRAKRKSVETSNEELQQRIHAQFEQVVERLRKKEAEVMEEVEKMKQKRVNLILGLQNQQETAWGQIDAVLRTQDDGKLLEEYHGLSVIEFNIPDNFSCSSFSPMENGGNFLWKRDSPRTSVDLNRVQDEIEKICLAGPEMESIIDGVDGSASNVLTPRQGNKRFSFKLDLGTAHSALKLSANQTSVEYVGAERNGVNLKHVNSSISTFSNGNPYNSKYPRIPNGLTGKLKRTQFATVLGDSSITQGKQYWEVSVNRSMEYRLGVAYKHIQGTKILADETNCWALCLTYPDRFSAIHKHHKDYIFIPTHTMAQTSRVIRIGIFLDYERGVLSFYNASTAAEKKHLYTFRTFFNRPVWPLLSLRQGKLQVLSGLPVPRNLVWKTR